MEVLVLLSRVSGGYGPTYKSISPPTSYGGETRLRCGSAGLIRGRAGRRRLGGASYRVIPDRLETGTLLLAGAATGGDVEVGSTDPKLLTALVRAMRRAGIRVDTTDSSIRVRRSRASARASGASGARSSTEGAITVEFLRERGLDKGRFLVKILEDGEVGGAWTIEAHAFSKNARSKIEKAGGKCVVK